MKAAGGSGTVTTHANGTGDGSSRSLYTQDRLADIVVTVVDRKTAGAQRTSLFGRCGSITGVGVFALDGGVGVIGQVLQGCAEPASAAA